MLRKIVLLSATLLVFAGLAMAKTLTGTVSDSNCGVKHATASDEAKACVQKCVDGGASYVLVSGGKVYKLDDQDKFKGLAGDSVKVTGTVKGDSITVKSVEKAGGA